MARTKPQQPPVVSEALAIMQAAQRDLDEAPLAPEVQQHVAWMATRDPNARTAIRHLCAALFSATIDHARDRVALDPLADQGRKFRGRRRGATNMLTRTITHYLDRHPRATADTLLQHLLTLKERLDNTIQDVVELPDGDSRIDWVDGRGKEKQKLFSSITHQFRARLRPEVKKAV